MNWRTCGSSCLGATHGACGLPCQDSNKHRSVHTRFGDYIILVVSDGCGTAKHSDIGSEIITSEVTSCISSCLQRSSVIPNLSDLIVHSLGHANQCLAKAATRLAISVNELAATCICLVVGPDRYAAAQIGDGIIVGLSNNVSGCLFWPSQEYANVTHSLTGRDWRSNTQTLDSSLTCTIPDSWFLATDGIQAIACDYEKKVPVSGFVSVLLDKFKRLSYLSEQDMQLALDTFLQSERVNSAVSDDKTVVLAFR